jgi:hypothetical protein
MAGTPYIVGEKGPELFVPNGSGNIIPNDKLGSGSSSAPSASNNITVNLSGIMASSRSDLRVVAKDLVESINEELRAKGMKEWSVA